MGQCGKGDRMRRGRRVVKATRVGGGRGSERREQSVLEREKKRKDAPGVCSVAPCVYKWKGHGIVKTKGQPPLWFASKRGSTVPVERKDGQREQEKKCTCIAAGGQKWGRIVCVTWKVWHCLGKLPWLTLWCMGKPSKLSPMPPFPLTHISLTPHLPSATRHCLIPFALCFRVRLFPWLPLGHALLPA